MVQHYLVADSVTVLRIKVLKLLRIIKINSHTVTQASRATQMYMQHISQAGMKKLHSNSHWKLWLILVYCLVFCMQVTIPQKKYTAAFIMT